MSEVISKSLNIRYVLYQIVFFSICAGTSGFAVTYLMGNGFTASQTGLILSISNICSCLMQPILGDLLDRLRKFVLPQIVAGFFISGFACFILMQTLRPSTVIFGILFGVGNFMLQITNSLNNSICAYYSNHNYSMNYGVGQGVGSLSFSFASLGYGYVIEAIGIHSMIWIVSVLLAALVIITLGYPKIDNSCAVDGSDKMKEASVSIVEFFKKYKLFVITMTGVLLVGICHAMSESYFIAIFQSMGGGSEDVGIAFFVGCLSAAPFFIFFEKIQKKIDALWFLKTAGVFFMLKTLLIILATKVWHVYLIQLLQTFTYGFLFQPLYYFARQRVSEADLVKGQAVAVSMYLLGTASGGFVGGRALDVFGLDRMLMLALMIAFAGTVIINVSLLKGRKIDGNKSSIV